MLLNLSNHPSASWASDQRAAAEAAFGAVQDIAFPAIPPEWGQADVAALAQDYAGRCLALAPAAVHVMGELTFTLAFVALAASRGLRCVASTTERLVKDLPGGDRQVSFRFVRFRDYTLPEAPP
jgi:hypothetical protein